MRHPPPITSDPGLGPVPEWVAASHWQAIDLLSDVHLQTAMPQTFEVWRHHLLNTPADAVLILGDLFEAWIGDDCRSLGFEAACAAVLKQAASRRLLAFMPGNRDFLVGDALLAETGVRPLADPTVLCAFGQRWLLSHGDALCLADHEYQRFRAGVRAPAWRSAFLARPLAERLAQAQAMREASAAHQAAMAPQDWADVDADEAVRWLVATGSSALLHGHTHRPGMHALAPGLSRHVLGDWDADHAPARARILRLRPSGIEAIDLGAGATQADPALVTPASADAANPAPVASP